MGSNEREVTCEANERGLYSISTSVGQFPQCIEIGLEGVDDILRMNSNDNLPFDLAQ